MLKWFINKREQSIYNLFNQQRAHKNFNVETACEQPPPIIAPIAWHFFNYQNPVNYLIPKGAVTLKGSRTNDI